MLKLSNKMLLLLWLLVAAAAVLAMTAGAVFIAPSVVFARFADLLSGRYSGDSIDVILFQTRLPRIILAASVGSALACSGAAAQSLFRNPLASPYIIGVSNGSALGAVIAMLTVGNFVVLGLDGMALFSILAGLAVTVLVFFLGKRAESFGNGLLLSGIAIGAFCSSLTSAALYIADERLQILVFWMMGGFWRSDWHSVRLMLPTAALGLAILMACAKAMNVALCGQRAANDMGVNVRRLQIVLLAVIAVQSAVAVSVSGVIGFVGLVVPHLMRFFTGADHNRLLPASACGGAILLIAADTLARTVAAPAEIPVGVLTSLIGGPVFIVLLQKRISWRKG